MSAGRNSRNSGETPFGGRLRRCRLRWQAGLCLRVLLKVLGLALVMLVLYGVLDFFLAFPPGVRIGMDAALIAILVGVTILHLAHILRLSDRDMAVRADDLLASRRRSVLSGLELSAELDALAPGQAGMRAFLLERGVHRCLADLKGLRRGDCFPKRELFEQCKVLGVQILLAAFVLLIGRDAAGTISARIFYPERDVPPYSKYVFKIHPPRPEVVYGYNAEVKVEISGRPVDARVWMLTRHAGEEHKAGCFQESDRVFAQRMEKVVVPLEFCFKTGRARSKWHSVDLRLQPLIAVARATIVPPEYTRLPAKQFYVGHEDFAAYRNSECRLEVTSNRPLLDGTLTIRPKGYGGDVSIVRGSKSGTKSVAFEWNVQHDAELEIVVRDVRGTRNKSPLEVEQRIIADEPPDTVITRPGTFVMATPAISIPLAGYSEDDLGLRRVELVRSVVGYRDRAKQFGPPIPSRRLDVDYEIDLERIGVEPGEVLEFYLEASDLNPSMIGISASSVVRVQVISEREYAESLRMKETLENFLSRYKMIADTIAEARDALRDLQEKLAEEGADAEEVEQAVAAARERLQAADKRLRMLGDDFPIYAMEKELYDFARKAAGEIGAMGERLGAETDRSALEREVARSLEEMGAAGEQMEEMEMDADEVARIQRLMECAGRFMDLFQMQQQLVNRLQRFKTETADQNLRLLEALGSRQAEIREQLVELVADIRQRSGEVDEKYGQLKATAAKFADVIEQLEIPPTMAQASAAAANQNGGSAYHFALLALEKLEQLQSSCEGDAFGGMCRNELKFGIPKPSMRMTVSQMMGAMAAGAGGRGGSGAGVGGSGSSGYSVPSYSPLNIPMFGPERISRQFGNTGGAGGGRGGTGTAGLAEHVAGDEQMSAGGDSAPRGHRLPMEKVPDRYRDAVRKYFSEEE